MTGKPQRPRRRPAGTPAEARRRTGSGVAASAVAVLVAVMIFALPTFVVGAVGMLPTIVAVWVDRSPRKYAAVCMGGLNLSGVAPYLVELWSRGGTLVDAFEILADVYAWLLMYGAAAAGWLLYLSLPPVVSTFLKIHAEQRITALRAEQEKLREEWGEAVTRKR